MLKLIAEIYVNTIRRFLTYWMNKKIQKSITNDDELKITQQKAFLKAKIRTTSDVINELKNFRWTSDPINGLIDYSPTIDTFLFQSKKDDCDGAAFYTKYLFDLIGGRECHIISLLSTKPFLSKSHVICIVKELDQKFHIFSNGFRYKENFSSLDECFKFYKQYNESDTLKYSDFYIEINY